MISHDSVDRRRPLNDVVRSLFVQIPRHRTTEWGSHVIR